MKISLCMIVKDEEDVISRCLSSAIELVDEIIILDTGSTDKTLDIINGFNNKKIKVSNFHWINDFSAARNKSLELATYDWVLMLDADEVLKCGSSNNLKNYINETNKKAYTIGIYNHVGKSNVSYTNVMFRLFNKLNMSFAGSIHEKLVYNLTEINDYGKIPDEICSIEHFGYSDDLVKRKDKGKRNIELAEIELSKNPQNAFNWYNLGAANMLDQNYDKALDCFSKVEDLSEVVNQSFLIDTFIKKSDCLLRAGKTSELINYVLEMTKNDMLSEYPDGYYFLGKAYVKENRIQEGLKAFNTAISKDNANLSYSIYGINSFISLIEIGRIKIDLGKMEEGLIDVFHGIFHKENINLLGIEDIRKYLIEKNAYALLDKLESLEKKHKESLKSSQKGRNDIIIESTKLIDEGSFKEAQGIILNFTSKNVDIELNNILSVTYMLEGDYDSALDVLERSMEVNSDDFDTCYNIAFIYAQKGWNKKAIEMYEKLSKSATDDIKEEILESLSNLKNYN